MIHIRVEDSLCLMHDNAPLVSTTRGANHRGFIMQRVDAIKIMEILKANCPKYIRDYKAIEMAIDDMKMMEKVEKFIADRKG